MLPLALLRTLACLSAIRSPPAPRGVRHAASRHASAQMNLFADLFDDGRLKAQKPYERPLLPALVRDRAASYVLKESMFSFSGEEFTVRDTEGNTVLRVEGANVNLGGFVIDKLGFKDSAGNKFMSVERRILAATTCYDIYNPSGECVAKVDREMFSATPVYKFFYEGDANPFPDFKAEGSFSSRMYTFYAGLGDKIARVNRGEEAFRDVDTYQVEVAAGVDAAAVLAMAVIIDEDHDESDDKRLREGQ
ncbi:hypothetical protein AB1Y20_006117 [Prymnesium parvum]|uniref:Phospholipid scramblase n=1 Tax=Prymnesium parvum TaxID=97485 RepID=A0AB34J527_PRYPA